MGIGGERSCSTDNQCFNLASANSLGNCFLSFILNPWGVLKSFLSDALSLPPKKKSLCICDIFIKYEVTNLVAL